MSTWPPILITVVTLGALNASCSAGPELQLPLDLPGSLPSQAQSDAVDGGAPASTSAQDGGADGRSADTVFTGELPGPEQAARLKLTVHVACNPDCRAAPRDAQHPAPVALWSQELDEVPQRFERDLRVDVYGLVLYGNAAVYDHAYGTDYELGAWQAFHAPGGGVSVTSRRPRPRLVFAVVTDGQPLRTLSKTKAKTWALRPAELGVVDFREAPHLEWAGGKVHARLGFESGRASFGLMLTSSDAEMPPHEHVDAWEVIGLLTADGHLRLGRAADAESQTTSRLLVDGDVAAVPKGTRHRWVPTSQRAMLAVQLYVPPGPEQRFKKLAAPR